MSQNSCSPDSVKAKIFAAAFVAEALYKITPRELISTLSAKFDLNGKQARDLIHVMVCEGELVYAYEHGCSFVTTSLYRPVSVSPRIVLLPPDVSYRPAIHEVIVRIRSGASFGSGEHPTTRLALRGIEYVMLHYHMNRNRQEAAVVDIGTGSGILAIAAVKLGVSRGIGLDTDACARVEAKENIKLNRLEKKIRITDKPLENFTPQRRIILVTANLRTPTLIQLCARMASLVDSSGKVVLSGIKAEELADIIARYKTSGFKPCWQERQKGWAGIVFEKVGH